MRVRLRVLVPRILRRSRLRFTRSTTTKRR